MFWVYTYSSEYGGDLHGDYPTAEEASQAVGRLALAAFKQDDGILRRHRIIEAETKEMAMTIGDVDESYLARHS